MAMPKFSVVSHVTVPILKLESGARKFFMILEPIHIANESPKQKAEREGLERYNADNPGNTKPIKPIPEIVKVYNWENETVYQVVCNEVFKSELRLSYPGNSYVGKTFSVEAKAAAENKRYKTYEITELRIDDEEALKKAPQPSMHIDHNAPALSDEQLNEVAQGEEELVAAGEHQGSKRKR